MALRPLNTLQWIGLLGTFTLGTSYATDLTRALAGPRDIWWTPATLAQPLEAGREVFELRVAGEPLARHLASGSLRRLGPDGQSHPVTAADVSLRLNHWEQTRAGLLAQTAWTGPLLGACLTLLGVGTFQRKRERGA